MNPFKFFFERSYLPHFSLILLTFICYIIKKIGVPTTVKNIWLIGENGGECLKDNSYHFFRFCREKHPNKPVFFIIKKGSANYDHFLKNDPNVLIYGSLRHAKIFIESEVLIFSVTPTDICYRPIFSLFKKDSTKIYLKHGILGLKKVESLYHTRFQDIDMICVVSFFEQKIFNNYLKFNHNIIRTTGLARYDRLTKHSLISTNNQIVYMPTWRNWSTKDVTQNNFLFTMETFLNSRKLKDTLDKHNISLVFMPHKNMKKVPTNVNFNSRVKTIMPYDTIIQDLILSSSLLITDYSSVAWDFYYLGKPVLFYQFDQEEYLTKKGSYIDFDNELFGEVFKECNPLVAAIEKYINNNFAELPEYAEKRDLYFKYRDTHNCRRIFDTIISFNKTKHG